MTRNIFLALAACLFVGILFVAVVVPLGLKVLYQLPAESFLKDFSTLKTGSSTFADVQQIRASHPGKSQNIAGVEQPCTADSC